MILDKDGNPTTVPAYVAAIQAEIDAAMRVMQARISTDFFAEMNRLNEASASRARAVALTRRQRLGLAWWRLRRQVARAVLRLAEFVSPGVASENCDC